MSTGPEALCAKFVLDCLALLIVAMVQVRTVNLTQRRFPLARTECLTADREFRGHRWLAYLLQGRIRFRLRIPNNPKTHNRHRHARLPVIRLFSVQIGETMTLALCWCL